VTNLKDWKFEKRENFNAWVETIEERILDWEHSLGEGIRSKLDYSIGSLDEIEKYLVNRFKLQDLENDQNRWEIDAIASYVMKVFEKNWSSWKYVLELDDDQSILFNKPAIITQPQIGTAFSPYMFIRAIINTGRIGVFRKNLESRKHKLDLLEHGNDHPA